MPCVMLGYAPDFICLPTVETWIQSRCATSQIGAYPSAIICRSNCVSFCEFFIVSRLASYARCYTITCCASCNLFVAWLGRRDAVYIDRMRDRARILAIFRHRCWRAPRALADVSREPLCNIASRNRPKPDRPATPYFQMMIFLRWLYLSPLRPFLPSD